jgi:uncharacterized protein YecE (DUF72 family)
MRTFIGTSGWDYRHWKGVFYPEGCPRTRWLDHYSRTFSTVEVNATFYHRIRQNTYLKWHSSTPEGFLWAVKASRFITHIRRLQGVEDSLDIFFSDVSTLGEKLGPLLFQFPPSLEFDGKTLEVFLGLLPAGGRYAVEARHPSWTGQDTLSMLREHNIAWCIADTAGRFPYLEAVTADYVYIRLHGSRKLYASEYTEGELRAWAHRIRSWERDAYVYFDNDFMGYAPKNALRLRELLS